MQRKLLAAAAVLVAFASGARADELVTTTGTKYSGLIVSEDEVTVTIDTPALGRMNLAKVDLATIKRDPRPAPAPATKEGDAAKPADTSQTPSDGAQKPADAAAKPTEADEATRAAAEAAAKAKAEAEAAAALLAEEREARRRSTKIVRKTEPLAAKAAPAAVAAGAATTPAPEETRASLGGTELAKAERGSLVIVYQPPRQFEGTPSGIQIGRRFLARLDSAGSASAWLSVPMAAGDEQVLVRLTDIQRHFVVKLGASRMMRMIEGIDRGAWLRVRLDDGSVAQGVLHGAQESGVTLNRPKADGSPELIEVAEDHVIEVDGLMRSTSTRLILNELAAGEPVALTLWPEGREIIGVLKERTDVLLTVDAGESGLLQVAVEGPVAEARRVPAKWRTIVTTFTATTIAHAKSVDEFPDAQVERDLIGSVAAITPYALSLDTADGVLVLPWETLTELGPTETSGEEAAAKPMKKSERSCRIPVRPGDPVEKTKDLDPEAGVTAVTDGSVVRNVLVAAPFDGEIYGIHLGDRVDDAADRTDLRFDTIITPRRQGVVDLKPAEMISNSLERIRVTLMLDAAGSVSAIELGAR